LTFTSTDRLVVFLRGARQQQDLDDEAARHSSPHKNVLILAVNPTNERILGWAFKRDQ
jgi:hypothetical protein